MKWIRYKGPSPSRDVPGVGEMKRGVAVQVSEDVAERLLTSESFVESEGEATPAPTGGEEE